MSFRNRVVSPLALYAPAHSRVLDPAMGVSSESSEVQRPKALRFWPLSVTLADRQSRPIVGDLE